MYGININKYLWPGRLYLGSSVLMSFLNPHSLGPCLSLCGGLLQMLSPSVFDYFCRMVLFWKRRHQTQLHQCCLLRHDLWYGTGWRCARAEFSLFSSGWDLKWWYKFVVLPPFVATLLLLWLYISSLFVQRPPSCIQTTARWCICICMYICMYVFMYVCMYMMLNAYSNIHDIEVNNLPSDCCSFFATRLSVPSLGQAAYLVWH